MTEIAKSFDELVVMIESARARAWAAVNAELVGLYWQIGKWLSERRADAKWGDKIVDAAAEHLKCKRPDLGSFTRRTLYRTLEFYDTYAQDEFVSPLVTQITWTNHLIIMSRAKSPEERRFYIEKCILEHYSKRQLERQFDSEYYARSKLGEAAPASAKVAATARTVIPDLYSLEFIDLPEKHLEKDLRHAIVAQMLSRSLSPTMVATYQFALPDKKILANRLKKVTELVMESAGVTELPDGDDTL